MKALWIVSLLFSLRAFATGAEGHGCPDFPELNCGPQLSVVLACGVDMVAIFNDESRQLLAFKNLKRHGKDLPLQYAGEGFILTVDRNGEGRLHALYQGREILESGFQCRIDRIR